MLQGMVNWDILYSFIVINSFAFTVSLGFVKNFDRR